MILNCVGGLAVLCYLYAVRYRHTIPGGLQPSARFMTFGICAVAMIISIALVNEYAPERKLKNYLISADTLSFAEADTSSIYLLQRNGRFHYHLVQKLTTFSKYEHRLRILDANYERFSHSS